MAVSLDLVKQVLRKPTSPVVVWSLYNDYMPPHNSYLFSPENLLIIWKACQCAKPKAWRSEFQVEEQ